MMETIFFTPNQSSEGKTLFQMDQQGSKNRILTEKKFGELLWTILRLKYNYVNQRGYHDEQLFSDFQKRFYAIVNKTFVHIDGKALEAEDRKVLQEGGFEAVKKLLIKLLPHETPFHAWVKPAEVLQAIVDLCALYPAEKEPAKGSTYELIQQSLDFIIPAAIDEHEKATPYTAVPGLWFFTDDEASARYITYYLRKDLYGEYLDRKSTY